MVLAWEKEKEKCLAMSTKMIIGLKKYTKLPPKGLILVYRNTCMYLHVRYIFCKNHLSN